MKRHRATLWIIAAAIMCALIARTVQAANIYWDGTSSSWNAAANWSLSPDATTPNPAAKPGAGDVAVFNLVDVNTPQSLRLDVSQSALGLEFNSSGTVLIQPGAGANVLTLGSGGINVNAGAGAVTISAGITLVAAQSWANHSDGSLSISNAVSLGANALSIGGSGTTTLSNPVNGTGGLVKNGSGVLLLNTANTFTGGLTLNAGVVRLGDAGALNASTPAVVTFGANSTGALLLNGKSITLGGLATNALVGTPIVQNAHATAAMLTIESDPDRTYGGTIRDGAGGGALTLVKSGTGKLTLGGANSYTGQTSVLEGTLQGTSNSLQGVINNAADLVFDQAFDGTFNGQVTGAGDVVKEGAGSLTLTQSFSSTGEMKVRAGQVLFSAGSNITSAGLFIADFISTTAAFTLTGSATLETPTFIVGQEGAGTFHQSGGTNRAKGGITLGAGVNAVGTYNLSAGTLTSDQLFVGGSGSGVFNQTGGMHVISSTDTAKGQLKIGGTTSNASGAYHLSGGTLRVASTLALGAVGNTTASLHVSGAGELTADQSIVVHNGAIAAIHLSGGIINTAALNLEGDPGKLNWTGGTLHITTNIIWDSAAAGTTTSAALGDARTLGGGQTLKITGHETLGGTGDFSLTLDSGSTHQVNGTLQIEDLGTLTQNPGSTLLANSIIQSGGTVGGTLQNESTFVYQAGNFDGRLVNQGNFSFGTAFAAANGVQNDSAMTLNLNQTLTANGAGFDNRGTLSLNSGTLAGNGPIVNNSYFAGNGTIGGGGGFNNNAYMTVFDGLLTLSNSGANANAGQIELLPGQQLRLAGGNLSNTGEIILQGGFLSGTATLNNSTGIVAGRGNISNPFTNGGTLFVEGGVLTTSTAFANTGEIVLGGGAATLGGVGAISNSGVMRGDGVITKAISNEASGQIRAENGSRLKFQGTISANAGTISLQGGTAEFAGPLTNAASGRVEGRGTLIAGAGVTNNGHIALSGGISDVHGDVQNSTGTPSRGIVVSGNADVTFWDDVANSAGSLFRVTSGSTVTVFGNYSGDGIAGSADAIHLNGDVAPGFSAGLARFGGNVHFSPSTRLHIELGGSMAGTQHDQLRVDGQLALDGTLNVSLLNGYSPTLGTSFTILDWETLAGTFANVELPLLGGSLAWNTSQIYTLGVISVVTSPGVSGDYNAEGKVDAADYVAWRKFRNTNMPLPNNPDPLPIGDDQYESWRRRFGQVAAGGAGGTVPEPAGFVVLMLAAITFAVAFRRRRRELVTP
jgi:autotransporter-associated beta strand protein